MKRWNFALVKPTLGNKLSPLVMAFVVMIMLVGMSGAVMSQLPIAERTQFLLSSALQNVFAFIFPAWLVARLCYASPSRYLGLSQPTAARQYLGMVLLYLAMLPAMNMIIEWNENIHLPEAMSGFEQTMRMLEDNAADITESILYDTSWWGLISGVLIVGCLTGLAEESFFRAGLQKAFTSSGINPHVSIWTVAVIFSAIHFQFFGFVPRVLLGAFFGYLYWYTGSLWIPAAAHALNNSLAVISSWLVARGWIADDAGDFLIQGTQGVVLGIFSLAATAIIIFKWGKSLFTPPTDNGTTERA